MYEVKRVDPMSLGKIHAAILAVAYFIGGILFGLGGMMLKTSFSGVWVVAASMIAGAVVGAILGFFIGVIGAMIYNFVVQWTGGVKLEIVQHPDSSQPPQS
jgi:uncharacterized membrane protein